MFGACAHVKDVGLGVRAYSGPRQPSKCPGQLLSHLAWSYAGTQRAPVTLLGYRSICSHIQLLWL